MTMDRPLGIADLYRERPIAPYPTDHWYWCRQHERAEHVSEPTTRAYAGWKECTRIGPFMSEREALRLTTLGAPYGKTVKHLGMEVEQ